MQLGLDAARLCPQGHTETARLYEATFKEGYMLSGCSYRGVPDTTSMLPETDQHRLNVSAAVFNVQPNSVKVRRERPRLPLEKSWEIWLQGVCLEKKSSMELAVI